MLANTYFAQFFAVGMLCCGVSIIIFYFGHLLNITTVLMLFIFILVEALFNNRAPITVHS